MIVPSTRPIYDSNLYNNTINNAIDEEKNISGLKSWSQVGVDLALIVNNASQLYYLYKSNNEVWPNTFQAWLLVGSLGLQFIALCLLGVDAGLLYFTCFLPNEKIRRILNVIICGLMYGVSVLNVVIQAIGWDGPISTNPSVHCSSNCTTEATP